MERVQGSSINNYILNEIKSCEDAAIYLIVINSTLIGIFLAFIMNIQSIETLRAILGAKIYSVLYIKIFIYALFFVWVISVIFSVFALIRRSTNEDFINEEYKLFIFLKKILNYKRKLLTISYISMIIGLVVTIVPLYYILPYQLNGIVETWENIGDDHLAHHRYLDSIQYYDMVIKTRPDNIPARIKMASALMELGNLSEALAYYDGIINDDSENIIAWRNKSIILYNLSNFNGALECCNKILNDLNYKCEETLAIKGAILVEMRNYDDAINACDEAIIINDQNKFAWFNKGCALTGKGDIKAAYDCFNKTTNIDRKYAEGWRQQYYALQNLGRDQDATKAKKMAENFGCFIK